MSVGSFDPKAGSATLSDNKVDRFLAAANLLEVPGFGFSDAEITELAPLARVHDGEWAEAAAALSDAEINTLIRLFTLAEDQFAAWESGAKSPVIALAKVLRERGSYPDDLTAWIKANTSNRFLPYGSLLDRL